MHNIWFNGDVTEHIFRGTTEECAEFMKRQEQEYDPFPGHSIKIFQLVYTGNNHWIDCNGDTYEMTPDIGGCQVDNCTEHAIQSVEVPDEDDNDVEVIVCPKHRDWNEVYALIVENGVCKEND